MPKILKGIIYSNGRDIYFKGTDEKGIDYGIVPLEPLISAKARILDGFFLVSVGVSVIITLGEKTK